MATEAVILASEAASWVGVGASIVALGIAVAPSLRGRLRRPALALEVGQNEPYCVAVPDGLDLAKLVVLRVGVKNTGKDPAQGVWVTVGRRWVRDLPLAEDYPADLPRPAVDLEWRLVDAEPQRLRWSSIPVGEERRLDVSHNQTEFAELALLEPSRASVEVAVADERAGRGSLKGLGHGAHLWEIVAGATNVDPMTRIVEFTVDGRNFFSGVAFGEAPPPGTRDHRLLTMLDQVVEDPPDAG